MSIGARKKTHRSFTLLSRTQASYSARVPVEHGEFATELTEACHGAVGSRTQARPRAGFFCNPGGAFCSFIRTSRARVFQ